MEEGIIRQAFRTRQPIPDEIQNAPELRLGLDFYYMAWQDLSGDRAVGMGPGPIPWSSVESYCDRLGMAEWERLTMHRHIRALDGAYFEYLEREREKKGS